MKTIKLTTWKAQTPDGKEVDENLVLVLNSLLNSKDPKEMPHGFAQAKIFYRLITAFDNSVKTSELVLDDADYDFLKEIIKNDTPAIWGANPNIMKALENFNAQSNI